MGAWTVLVVDDEASYRAVLSVIIDTDARFRLLGVANDGQAAIDQVRRQCPDAIILDVRMPNMDGLTALPQLRRACPGAVIAMYSSDLDAAAVALDCGADMVADKAESASRLLDRLAALCSYAPAIEGETASR
jgi:two-component system, chemotaxis family, protein-glutamate methylesterase/glutaminase